MVDSFCSQLTPFSLVSSSDSSVGGSTFGAVSTVTLYDDFSNLSPQAASPSLSHFLRQAALDVPHPTSPGRTLWDARNDKGPFDGKIVDAESMAVSQSVNAMADSVGVSPLGSGSDFTFVVSFKAVVPVTYIFPQSLFAVDWSALGLLILI